MSVLSLTNLSVRRTTKKRIRTLAKRDGRTIYGVVDQAVKLYERMHIASDSFEPNGRADRDMTPAPTGNQPCASTPPSGDALLQGDITEGQRRGKDAELNPTSFPTTGDSDQAPSPPPSSAPQG